MKYFLLVVALLAAVILTAMYVPIKDGKTLLDASMIESAIPGLQNPEEGMADDGMGGAGVPAASLYRWKDQYGNWQYGDRPPTGVAAEPVTLKETQRLENLPQGTLAPQE